MTPTTSTPSATQSPLALSASRTSSTGGRPHAVAYRKRKHRSDKDALGSDNDCNDFSDDESSRKSGSPSIDDDRRAHHNELERRRRDHIKDHFQALKNSVPLLEGEKSSRAMVLKRAADYITLLQAQIKEYKLEMEEVRRHNDVLAQHAQMGMRSLSGQLHPSLSMHDAALHQMNLSYSTSQHVAAQTMPTSAVMFAALQRQQQHQQWLPPSPPTFDAKPPNGITHQFPHPLKQQHPETISFAELSQLLLQNPLLAAQLQQSQRLSI
ncbi:MXL-3 protein [Aphelenchoides avenae]|nr:MXL-3 protein [Aphelenchus avenae]